MTEACIACAKRAGYAQLELEAVAENKSAIALYESVGFTEYGRNPRGFRSRLTGWQELALMRLELDRKTEPFDKVIETIRGNPYFIHHNDEAKYDYLDDGDISIEVLDTNGLNSMSIGTEGMEYRLFFGYNHEHFYMDEAGDLERLLNRVDDILHNRQCAASIFHYKDGKRLHWLGSCFLTAESAANDSVESIFNFVYCVKEFSDSIRQNGGEAHFEFWDASFNRTVFIAKGSDKER